MKPLRCLITAGPTREHLDPVRYLSNGSSGKMGYALAEVAQQRGWQVDLVSGPVGLPRPSNVNFVPVISAREMLAACENLFPECDLFISVAAVADYRPKINSPTKLKKVEQPLILELEPNVDILKTLAQRKTAAQRVVGFAAETHDLEFFARQKLLGKNLDWIVANDVSGPDVGMNADRNTVLLISRSGETHSFGPADKIEVARFILEGIEPLAR
jgi:phosphopantothenoylcysteine synthetase/decarboxylase